MPDIIPQDQHYNDFFELLQKAISAASFEKVVLAKYCGAEKELMRINVRLIQLRDDNLLSFVYSYKTNDITKINPISEGVQILEKLIPNEFKHAHLLT